jgi:putative ABC transport system permease protein
MGTDLLFVRPGSTNQGGVNQGSGTAATLTYEDAKAIADPINVPSALGVSPEMQSGGQVVYQGVNVRTRTVGVVPEYELVRNAKAVSGQFITEEHLNARAKVAVLGATTATNLFATEDPVGKVIRITNQPFTVIGVLEAKGGSGFGNQDDMILVPLTTLQQRLYSAFRVRGEIGVESIAVKVVNKDSMAKATTEIQTLLRERHRVIYDDDFTVQNQQDMLNTATQMTDTLTLFLGGVAAISLLVGGIGIMNIMLVSVTERTREIGIRKAVGAKRRDIQLQFLTEAALLSVSGGILGILIGIGISQLMGRVNFGGSSITPVVGLDSILLATAFSLFVGIFFGFYPANRAARLDPITALRYE